MFLHSCGADLRTPGHILLDFAHTEWVVAKWPGGGISYSEFDWSKMRRNITPLTIARECEHQELVAFLEATLATDAIPHAKRDAVTDQRSPCISEQLL